MNNLVISVVANSVFLNGASASNLVGLPIPNGIKSLYWDQSNSTGWLENIDSSGVYIGNTDITELPTWADECVVILEQAITPQPISAIELCKLEARNRLMNTDWSEIPSVSDTQNTPHLLNLPEFLTYRNTVRVYVTNPVENPVWPTEPLAIWS